MSNPTSAFGWQMPTSSDLVTDLPADFEVFGQAVDTSLADLKGGTSGQILSKNSNTDMDFVWITNDVGDITAVTAGTGITGGGTSGAVTITNSMATEIAAKGDLIVGTGSQTFDNLTAGSNGETLVADSSTSTGLRYQALKGKNCIYNSAMQVWQRGTSFTVLTAGGEYTADRWYAAFSGIAGRTLSRQTGTAQFQYVMRVARDSGNTNTTGLQIGQSLEIADATLYAGQTVTFSYYARKGANYSATSDGLVVQIFSGTSSTEANRITTAYAAGGVTDLNVTTTLTSSLTRFSHTITLGASVTQFAVKFTFTPTGTAGAADYFEITGLQFEVGSVPTTFNPMGGSIQQELAACQRYYYRKNSEVTAGAFGVGQCFSTTGAQIAIPHPVTMRTTPTLARSGLSLNNATGTRQAVSAISNNGSNVNTFSADFTSSGIVAGNATTLVGSGTSTTDYIEASAEL